MKKCRVCKQEKETINFSQNKSKKDYLNDECKECQKIYFKKYYLNNKNKHIKRVLKTNNNKTIILGQIKLKKGCYKCGYNKHSGALHFHHLDKDKKSFNISQNKHLSLESLKEEIEKCEVICANCHAEEHFINFGKYKSNEIKNTKKRINNHTINRYKSKKTSKIRITKCPPKEELEALIWDIPTTDIAKKYKVSDKCIEKWCKKHQLTKPPRGYWQKKRANK